MAKSKAGKENKLMAPASPPVITTTTTTPTGTNTNTKHNTTAAPVQIPRSKWEPTKPSSDRSHHDRHRSHRARDVYSPAAIPPSIHALLVGTTIPRPRNARAGHRERRRQPEKDKESERRDREKDESLTLEAVIKSQQVPDKELSLSLSKSPLELLLETPEYLGDDDDDNDNGTSFSDSLLGSLASTLASTIASTRTVSAESVPSLTACSSSTFGTSPSTDDSPQTPPLLCRRRGGSNSQFVSRPSLEPVSPSSTGGDSVAHPLSTELKVEELDFRVFQQQPAAEDGAGSVWDSAFSRLPLRSAFKSNLTASLRAIRSAAKSFSSISLASIPPDDLLTRSLLAIDPRVPYTDERRPPVLEEEPSAALRRYLNPTTRSRVEDSAAGALPRPPRQYIATIQMQTYKIERLRENARLSRLPVPVTPRTREPGSAPAQQAPAPVPVMPAMRQREMRENPDFIRVAVLEMAMRRRGKLNDERPGRARWALPARRAVTRAYEIGEDGVPARWVPVAS